MHMNLVWKNCCCMSLIICSIKSFCIILKSHVKNDVKVQLTTIELIGSKDGIGVSLLIDSSQSSHPASPHPLQWRTTYKLIIHKTGWKHRQLCLEIFIVPHWTIFIGFFSVWISRSRIFCARTQASKICTSISLKLSYQSHRCFQSK